MIALAEEQVEARHAVVAVEVLPFRIDERAIESDSARDGLDDMVCPLAELERHRIVGFNTVNVADPNVVDWVVYNFLIVRPYPIAREEVTPDAPDTGKDKPVFCELSEVGVR